MLVIRERVHGGDPGVMGELLHVPLSIGAEYRAVNHAPQHPRGVFDRFALPAEFPKRAGNDLSPQFADSDLERHRVRVEAFEKSMAQTCP